MIERVLRGNGPGCLPCEWMKGYREVGRARGRVHEAVGCGHHESWRDEDAGASAERCAEEAHAAELIVCVERPYEGALAASGCFVGRIVERGRTPNATTRGERGEGDDDDACA